MRDESVRGWSSSGPINLRERWFKMEAVLEFEVWGFLGLLGAVLTYRILTRQFSLQGLLLRKNGSRSTSPERVQLLAATLALSGRYLTEVFHNPPCGKPRLRSIARRRAKPSRGAGQIVAGLQPGT